jgi:ribonucleoside-diphosphate reductase alpha chain
MRDAAYRASVALAQERGAFSYYERDRFLERPFVRALPEALREAIARDGLRNSHLLAVAPAGTISLLAGNVSSGLEPVFALEYERRVRWPDGSFTAHRLVSPSVRAWRERGGAALPPAFVDSRSLDAEAHLAMQACVQPFVDSAISKTLNVPASTSPEAFAALFQRAYALGLKGVTAFRESSPLGAVLSTSSGSLGTDACSVKPGGPSCEPS